jgi:cell wall-associated NlpC family hydrolase
MTPEPSRRGVLIAMLMLSLAVLAGGCSMTGGRAPSSEAATQQLMAHYRQWHGTPYRLGGNSRRGVDCSAYVQSVYREVYRVELPRSTSDQARVGRRVGRSNLRSGDLVFFKTGWFKYHVGVYVGGERFIHASESRGVIESSLSSTYWSRKYWKARRVV